MTYILNATLLDLRSGRKSWRVNALLALPALIIGVLNAVVSL